MKVVGWLGRPGPGPEQPEGRARRDDQQREDDEQRDDAAPQPGAARASSPALRAKPRPPSSPGWRWCRRSRSCCSARPSPRAACALCGTRSTPSVPSSGLSRLSVGGTIWSRIARMQKIASTAPAPPSRWPIADLVELIDTLPIALPNRLLDRAQLDRVGHGRGAVGVDIVDVGRGHARLLQRHLHRAVGARPFRMRRGDVIGVARQAVADHLGIDFRAARLGMLIFLEHDDARALAHDEAVAVLVIGPARLLRPVVDSSMLSARAWAKPAMPIGQIVASAPPASMMSASSSRIIRAASPIECAPVEQAVTTAWFGPIRPYLMLHLARDQVDQAAVDEVRADPARPLLGQHQALALDPRQAADARADRARRRAACVASSISVRPASSSACPAASRP